MGIATSLENFHAKYNAICCLASAFGHLQPNFAVTIIAAVQTDSSEKRKEPLEPLFQWEVDRAIEQAHMVLDESAFDTAWAEGETMTIDQAIDLALKILDEI